MTRNEAPDLSRIVRLCQVKPLKQLLRDPRLIILCLLLLIFNTGLTVQAAEEGTPEITSFQVKPLFEGYYREGGWTSLEITITNGRNPFSGEIRTNTPVSINAVTSDSDFVIPVSLAPNSKGRYIQNLQPNQRITNINVGLFDKNGKNIRQEPAKLQISGSTEFVIGILDDELKSSEIPQVNFMLVRGNSTRIKFMTFTSDQLTDRSEVLDPLDALVFGNVNPANLTAEKRRAILAWISQGGQLYFFGNPNMATQINASELPANSLPAQVDAPLSLSHFSLSTTSEAILDFSGTYNIPAYRLTPTTGALVAARQSSAGTEPGLPLLVSKQLGLGAIMVFSFNPFSAPLPTWNRYNLLWGQIIVAGNPNFVPYNSNLNFFNQDALGRVLLNAPGPDLPDGTVVFLVFLGYALLAGPVTYIGLKLLRRYELALLIIPFLALVLASAIILVGDLLPVGNYFVSRASIIESQNDDLPATGRSLITTYSGTDESYQLKFEGGSTALRPQPVSPLVQVNFMPPKMLVQGTDSHIISTDDRSGRLESLGTESINDLRLNLEAQLSASQTDISGTITNRGNHRIKEAVLIYGDNFFSAGSLNPGEEKKINFPLNRRPLLTARPSIDPNIYVPVGITNGTSQTPNTNTSTTRQPNAWLLGSSPESRLALLRWTTLNTAYQGRLLAPDGRVNTLYFTGWIDEENVLGTVSVESKKVVLQDRSLIIRPLPLSYVSTGNVLQVPPAGLLSDRVGDSSTSTQSTLVLSQSSNFTIFQYRLPVGFMLPKFLPTQFHLVINSYLEKDRQQILSPQQNQVGFREPPDPGNLQYSPKVEFYNWQKSSWVELSALGDKRQRIDLTPDNLSEYIDPNISLIQLRLSASGDSVVIQQVNLGIEGQNL